MRRKTRLTVIAATLAAGLLAAPMVLTAGSDHGAERSMMGPGTMGPGMMGQGMMDSEMMRRLPRMMEQEGERDPGMMGMMNMMAQMSGMMEECQRMMQSMMGDHDHDGQQPNEQ